MRFQRPMAMIPAITAHSVVTIAFNRSSSRTWNPVAMSTLIARPIAARGVSHGRMPVAIGRTRHTDASTSAVPIPRTRPRGRLEKPVHSSRPRPLNFGNAAPRKRSARKSWTIQKTMFTIPGLPELGNAPRTPVSPSRAALHCRCREIRVLGLKETVGAEVFDLVLVERNEHLMQVVEAIRAPDDLCQSAHQLALPVDWEASRASNLDEDPGRLGLHGPFLAASDFEHRGVTDILIGHLVDVHAVIGHLVRLVEDVKRSLDQLLLGFPCESRRTQDGYYGHGFFSFTLVPIPFKVRANALRSPTNRSGSSIAAK